MFESPSNGSSPENLTIEYRGYVGRVQVDATTGLLHGEVLNTSDVITFQGYSEAEVTSAFEESIEDYLAFCRQRGELPNPPTMNRQ